ncbi:MAG: hypothetical protein Q9226_007896 [Calogaya cf. arnoldii]
MATSRRLVGISPPPPGKMANFENPETQAGSNIALHTVMLFFVTFAIADFCVFGFCLLICYAALLLASGHYFLGHHLWEVTLPNYVYGRKLQSYAEFVYLVVSATIKTSCLLFYRRIFGPSLLMTRVIYGSIAFITVVYLELLNVSIMFCTPVNKRWDAQIAGACMPSGGLAYASGAFNVATDIFVVLLPLPALWQLNMRLGKKIRIMAVFGLGIMQVWLMYPSSGEVDVCGTSVVALSITRLAKTPMVFHSKDASWDISNFAIYTILELDIGMICSCLLAFPAFIDRYGPGLMSRLRSYSNLLKSSTREASSTKLQRDSNDENRKTSVVSSKDKANLADEAGPLNMHTTFPEAGKPSYQSSYRGKLEHLEMV